MIIKFCGASTRMRHESRTFHQADSPASMPSMSMPSPSMPSPRFSILRPSAEDKSESPITAAERGVAQAMSALGIKKPSVNTCTGEGLMRQELRDPSPDPGPFMCDDPASPFNYMYTLRTTPPDCACVCARASRRNETGICRWKISRSSRSPPQTGSLGGAARENLMP